MKKIIHMALLIAVPISSFALFNPYTYLNYLQDMRTAANSATSLTNQATQIQNQIQSIRYQAQNSGHVSNYQYNEITQLMQRMDSITNQGRSISYNAANIDQQFRARYPNYANQPNTRNYQSAYHNWNASTLNTINNSMQSNGMMSANFQHESQLMSQLRNQGKTATGRMQVLQASNEIAAENVNQLQELQRITLSQANSQNAYMAYRVSKDSYHEENLQELEQNTSSSFPPYQNNSRFGQIQGN